MRTGPRTILLHVVAVVVAVACTSAEDASTAVAPAPDPAAAVSDGTPTPTPTPTPTAVPRPDPDAARTAQHAAPGPAALEFTARRLDGGRLVGSRLAGGDVAVWMWAPWCPQCNREAPHVATALAAFGDRVTFVGMAGHDTDDAHRAFVAEHGLGDMVHVVDEDGSLWARFGVSYQPAWVFIDDDGAVRTVAGGLYQDLEARLQALVDE